MASDLSGLDLFVIRIDGLHMDDTLRRAGNPEGSAGGRARPRRAEPAGREERQAAHRHITLTVDSVPIEARY